MGFHVAHTPCLGLFEEGLVQVELPNCIALFEAILNDVGLGFPTTCRVKPLNNVWMTRLDLGLLLEELVPYRLVPPPGKPLEVTWSFSIIISCSSYFTQS